MIFQVYLRLLLLSQKQLDQISFVSIESLRIKSELR